MFRVKHKWYQTVLDGEGGEPAAGADPVVVDPIADPAPAEPAIASNYPSDWRQTYAGDDEKKLARLERYTSPAAAFDAMLAAQNRISSGELKAVVPFPNEGSEEEQASWRTENGLPTESSGYNLTFDDGLVIGEDDQPRVDDFLGVAHANNFTNDQVKAAVAWNQENAIKAQEAQAETDANTARETTDALNAEWGQDYRGNINRIHGLLDGAPEGVKEKLMSGRTADGVPIFSDLESVRFFANLAQEINPATTLVPAGDGNIAGTIDDEIAAIETKMGDRGSEYFKGPMDKSGNDTVMAVRYGKLLEAREKMAARA